MNINMNREEEGKIAKMIMMMKVMMKKMEKRKAIKDQKKSAHK